ncbi:ECF transporter S component [Anaerotignum sp.]|nr:ATP-binding cassette domain-containing protein [Anaerotignum sp.]
MELFTIRNLSFTYPEQAKKAIDGLSLSVQEGEFLVLCGSSGCGKSTLLRQLKTTLSSHGRREGEILFKGIPLKQLSHREQAQKIGFVQQSPENQIVTDKVWHELAFGLESLGYETPVIRHRVAEMAAFFGIEEWFYKNVTELSGGQKQLLNLASVMAMQPSVLILDEPTSQLDPIAASEFLSMLGKINRELGTTIILTEHRLEEAFPLASRVAVMEKGKLLCVGTAQEVGKLLKEKGHEMFLAMPAAMQVWAAVENRMDCPVTVRDGREWLRSFAEGHDFQEIPKEKEFSYSDEVVLEGKELWFRYEKDGKDIVKGLDLKVRKGEFLALLGGNGTGKTTSLKLLSGLLRPYRGEVKINGSVGVLPQNPQTVFVKKTVREDLYEICKGRKWSAELQEKKVAYVTAICRLAELLERHPYDLSGGEQQRAALAKVLLLELDILFLDEPTKGLDAEFKQVLAEILQRLLQRGMTIIMVSHDVEFCAQYVHSCGLFFDGNIVTMGTPRKFFFGNSFYTTAANRMARDVLPMAVTTEDVIIACGGNLPPAPDFPQDIPALPKADKQDEKFIISRPKEENRKLQKRTILAAWMILLAIPLTLFISVYYLGSRKYNIISLVILLETMLPFFLIFEGRKPKARELVIIAVLCALGVAGRTAFFMLPQFKPVIALTIIAGVAFGGESGFLVGAMTMLVSNMLFSQGPWAPWQMFAMGIIGFLAGILFRKGMLQRKRLSLCIFGALSAVFIYGGIMNPAAALLSGNSMDLNIILAYYLTGLPVDCIQGLATWLFLWFAAEPMLEKLDRIKMKYGLVE